MASDEQQQQDGGRAERAPEPIAQILGRRLREAREEAGLRQEDIAQAATRFGFKWGRSSVAALEAGARKLSAEELLMLPRIAQEVGLPGDQLIQDTDAVLINDDLALWGRSLRRMLLTRSESQSLHKANKQHRKKFEDAIFARTPATTLPIVGEFLNPDERLRNARFYVDRYASMLLGVYLWPQLDEHQARKAVARSVHPAEADRKVAAKIDADPHTVSLMAEALWGRSLTEERDARADERSDHEDPRALQGARGYVTRELTQELNLAWNAAPRTAPSEYATKRQVYQAWLRTIAMHYEDAERLESSIATLARLAAESRGEPLQEIAEELRYIFDSNDEDSPQATDDV